jgi:hypothetical protein
MGQDVTNSVEGLRDNVGSVFYATAQPFRFSIDAIGSLCDSCMALANVTGMARMASKCATHSVELILHFDALSLVKGSTAITLTQ